MNHPVGQRRSALRGANSQKNDSRLTAKYKNPLRQGGGEYAICGLEGCDLVTDSSSGGKQIPDIRLDGVSPYHLTFRRCLDEGPNET